jgi:dTDP-4-amino-4,6-dideoxygalactose transaminase
MAVLEERVPVMRPLMPPLELATPRIQAVNRSGIFANFGPQEQELRQRFAERLRVDDQQVAIVANATLGLAGAVATLGGERWAVPAFTFAATPAALLTAGSEVVFADVGTDIVLDVDARLVAGCMTIAPFGARPDLDRWAGSGRVVHDAAASLGNTLDLSGLPAGQAVAFSLHATKVLGAGEGGVVVFGDEADAARFRAWTNFGFAGSREAQVAGVNAKMSEIQACFVHAALDGWEQERAEWAAARGRVEQMAAAVGVELFRGGDGINPYAIAVFSDAATTLRVATTLAGHGVGTRRWWSMGCHRMPAYAHLTESTFPVTDDIAGRTLGLPLYRGMSDADVETVRVALEDALAQA